MKFLVEVSNSMVSGDDSAKKGTQLSLIEDSYINNEFEKQLRPRYDQFILLNILLLAGLRAKFTASGNLAMD